MDITVTTGIPGLACSEHAFIMLSASISRPTTAGAPSHLHSFSSSPHCPKSTSAHRAKHQSSQGGGGSEIRGLSIPTPKQARTHTYFKSAIPKGTQGTEKGTPEAAARQSVVCTTASMLDIGVGVRGLVTVEEESTEQTLPRSRMNRFYSYLHLQLTGLFHARRFKCVAFPSRLPRDHPDRDSCSLPNTSIPLLSDYRRHAQRSDTAKLKREGKNTLGARGNASLMTFNQSCDFLKP